MSLEPKRAYKVVLIGDPEVGKTSIRRKYMGKGFRSEYLRTIGADFAARKVDVEGETVLLTIWDLAGQSIFQGMRSSFYQGCKCALVVFDITNAKTLTNAVKWAEEAALFAKNAVQDIYLIGNKIDLLQKREVSVGDIQSTAKHVHELTGLPVKIYETSALTGENIQELFIALSKRLILGHVDEDISDFEKTPSKLSSSLEPLKSNDQVDEGSFVKEGRKEIEDSIFSLVEEITVTNDKMQELLRVLTELMQKLKKEE